jgi:uncharacterized membrane protein YedE/YeeE
MARPFLWLAVAVAAAPAFAWIVYRLAKGLGFLESPSDRQHELRRTIIVAIYALLLFLPVLFYGIEKRWPRAWIIFGVVDGAALLFFAASGAWAARALWKIRHPEPVIPSIEPMDEPQPALDVLANAPMRGSDAAPLPLADPPAGT